MTVRGGSRTPKLLRGREDPVETGGQTSPHLAVGRTSPAHRVGSSSPHSDFGEVGESGNLEIGKNHVRGTLPSQMTGRRASEKMSSEAGSKKGRPEASEERRVFVTAFAGELTLGRADQFYRLYQFGDSEGGGVVVRRWGRRGKRGQVQIDRLGRHVESRDVFFNTTFVKTYRGYARLASPYNFEVGGAGREALLMAAESGDDRGVADLLCSQHDQAWLRSVIEEGERYASWEEDVPGGLVLADALEETLRTWGVVDAVLGGAVKIYETRDARGTVSVVELGAETVRKIGSGRVDGNQLLSGLKETMIRNQLEWAPMTRPVTPEVAGMAVSLTSRFGGNYNWPQALEIAEKIV